MKNNLKKIKQIFLLFTTFLLASCSKDAYEELNQESSKNYKVKRLTSKDLKKHGKLVKKLDNFKAFTKMRNENNRSETSSIYDFSIETDNVKLIETDSIKSYTFKVNRIIDNGLFENLQIIKKTDGNYVAKLLQYNLTNEEKSLFLSGGSLDVNGKLTTLNIDDANFISNVTSRLRGDCFDLIITSQENPCASGEHCYGQSGCVMPASLQAQPDSNVYTIVSVDCGGGAGGDDLGDGVITTPVGGAYPVLDTQDIFESSLSLAQHNWLNTQPETVMGSIYNYLIVNNYNTTSSNFIKNLINYLILNPNVSLSEIIDSFFSPYPEVGNYIDVNPNDITYETPLTIQNLPSLASFVNNFPKNGTSGSYTQMSASSVYNLVGGSLLNSFNNNPNAYSNACSIRGSRGLLYSNIQIPVLNYNGSQRTQKGGDLKNYILDAISFNKFMIDKFGETSNKLVGAAANNPLQVLNFLSGQNGIYVIINNDPSKAGYTGHVDLILNGNCIGNEYLQPVGGIKSIRIWSLN